MTDAVNQQPAAPIIAPNAPPAPNPQPTPPIQNQAPPPNPAPTPTPAPVADTPFSFTATGNPRTDLALDFFGRQGLKQDSFEIERALEGDFGPLKAYLGTRGDKAKGHENYVALAEEAYADHVKNQTSSREARQKIVYEAVGGEENWNSIQQWVEKAAPAEDVKVLKAAIQQGGIAARLIASALANEYANAAGTTVQPTSATTANTTTAQPASLPLTRASYQKEVMALVAKIGSNNMDASPEYTALRQKYANVRQ